MSSYRLELKNKKVLLVGGAFVDVTLMMPHLPVRGGDVYAEEKQVAVGGCALNVAHALRQMGIEHDLVVPLGEGPYASIVEKTLTQEGYKLPIKAKDYGVLGDCAYCLCLIDQDGERTFVVVPGIEYHFQEDWLNNIDLKQYDLIYMSGFDLSEHNGMVYLKKYLQKEPHTKLFLDGGARVDFIYEETLNAIYKTEPILHINRLELELMTGLSTSHNMNEALDILEQKTKGPIVLSLDKEGTLVSFKGQRQHLPVIPQKVIDATGAGDAHSAGIIASLLHGHDLSLSCKFANIIAGKAIKQLGARLSLEADFNLKQSLQNLA